MTVDDDGFDPGTFLPYLLNQAAETTGEGFRKVYRDRYGMLRTEWRVLFHLGHYGDMTARQICDRASLHKTKVSRAVAKLETRRFLSRHILPEDRRNERLALTPQGRAAFDALRRRIEEGEPAAEPAQHAELVVRRSTGPAPGTA